MNPQEVVRAANDWVYVPEAAPTVETDDYLLVRFPGHFADPLEVVRFTPRRPVAAVVEELMERARGFGLPSLVWRVRLDSPPGAEEQVRELGGTPVETLDVFALDLGQGLPDLGDHGVELRWATDVVTARDAFAIGAEVFGGDLPPDAEVYRSAARSAVAHPIGRGGSLVAYLDQQPAGTGGVTALGHAAGLWGGSVLEPFRGRGVYRALLAARLEYAVAHEMTMAIVKGRVETSGPILRRAGFGVFGQERSYRLALEPSS